MKNFFTKHVVRRRKLVFNEKDTMTVLKGIDEAKRKSKINRRMEAEIRNCGLADKPELWYIEFNVSDGQWGSMITKLEEQKRMIVMKLNGELYLL